MISLPHFPPANGEAAFPPPPERRFEKERHPAHEPPVAEPLPPPLPVDDMSSTGTGGTWALEVTTEVESAGEATRGAKAAGIAKTFCGTDGEG